MRNFLALAGQMILLAVMILITVFPSIATAAEQPTTTPSLHPTTLGQTSAMTNPTFYFMLVGACIILGGGLAIFMRYSK